MQLFSKRNVIFKFKKAFLNFGTKKESEILFFDFLVALKKYSSKPPISVLSIALENVKPFFELRPKKVAGAKYNLPYLLSEERGQSYAIRLLIKNAKLRSNTDTLPEKIAQEVFDAYLLKGTTYKQIVILNEEVSKSRPFLKYLRRK
jgi:small subunit ribosomal protein S7